MRSPHWRPLPGRVWERCTSLTGQIPGTLAGWRMRPYSWKCLQRCSLFHQIQKPLLSAVLSAILERWSCVSVVHVRFTFSVVLWTQQWLPVEQMQGATVDLASRFSNMRHALLGAVKAADQRDDEIMGSRLKWQLCYAILMGAEGATFPVSRILSIIKQASLDTVSFFSCL